MARQPFYSKWINDQHFNAEKLATLHVDNNSMAPRIQNGDQLLIDQSQTLIHNGRIYAIWIDNHLQIKRLYEQDDGSLLMKSDVTESQGNVHIPVELRNQIHILGRVVHVQGTAGL